MMKPTRPQISKGAPYPQEFREEAVQYWLSCGHTLAAVAADLGLSPERLRSWRKQMAAAARVGGDDSPTRHFKKAISIFSENTLNGGLK